MAASLDKIKAFKERQEKFHSDLGTALDAEMAAYDELDKQKTEVLAKHSAYRATVKRDLDAAQNAVDQLSNLPLDGGDKP